MKLFFTSIVITLSTLAYSQSYEGTITYKGSFEPAQFFKSSGMTIEQLKDNGAFSDNMVYSYKGGNYHKQLDNKIQSYSVYIADSNKIYFLDQIYFNDECVVTNALNNYSTAKDSIAKLDTTVILNNITCSIIKIYNANYTIEYYYNSDMLKVDASLYKNHITNGFGAFLNESNSLPIKVVHKVNMYGTTTSTMVSYEEKPINDEIFKLPKLEEIMETNYGLPKKMKIIRE